MLFILYHKDIKKMSRLCSTWWIFFLLHGKGKAKTTTGYPVAGIACYFYKRGLAKLHHAAHSTHTGTHRGSGGSVFFLFGNHTLGGQEHTGN